MVWLADDYLIKKLIGLLLLLAFLALRKKTDDDIRNSTNQIIHDAIFNQLKGEFSERF